MSFALLCLLCLILSGLICAGAGAFDSLAWLWALPLGAVACVLVAVIVLLVFFWAVTQCVDTKKPQRKDSAFFRNLTYFYIWLFMPVLGMQVHVTGMEKVPTDRRIMLVSNHLNDLDPVVLLYYFRKNQLAFISKRENGTMFIVGKLMHKLMCQLINRENDREALKTILKCAELLKDDVVSIGVFPEGYTSLDGLLHPFRHGVFKIAQKAQVPIVVCTLQNTQYVFRNALRLQPTDIYLDVLEVIEPGEIQGVTAVSVGTRVHKIMADHLGPEKVLPETEEKP